MFRECGRHPKVRECRGSQIIGDLTSVLQTFCHRRIKLFAGRRYANATLRLRSQISDRHAHREQVLGDALVQRLRNRSALLLPDRFQTLTQQAHLFVRVV